MINMWTFFKYTNLSPSDYEITSTSSQLISFMKFIAAVHTETTLNIGITQQFNAMLIGQ